MISICIPTKDAGADFARNLRAWTHQQVDEEVELVVIDSGSHDATPSVAQERGARVACIQPEEFNHGETRNELARQATGDILVFTVQDALPCDEFLLRELVCPLREQPGLAATTGQQIPHADADLLARWEVNYYNSVLERERSMQVLSGFPRLSGDFLQRFRAAAFDNVCSALRRSVWEIHPFARLPYGEDLDWSVRILRAGHSLLRTPGARIYHSHNAQPYQRLQRTFVSHWSINRILQLPPALPCLQEDEIFSGIGHYLALVTQLQGELENPKEPIHRLRLSAGLLYDLSRILDRMRLGGFEFFGMRSRCHLIVGRLTAGFNWMLNEIIRHHGGLSRLQVRFVLPHVALQVLGDFLGECAYAQEVATKRENWLEEWTTLLRRGV